MVAQHVPRNDFDTSFQLGTIHEFCENLNPARISHSFTTLLSFVKASGLRVSLAIMFSTVLKLLVYYVFSSFFLRETLNLPNDFFDHVRVHTSICWG
jgi:hypothetical protein